MNKQALQKTALCRFDPESGDYIVQSPLCEIVMGVDDTEEGAWTLFQELLNETYEDYLEGKLAKYPKPGRPAKGKTSLHAEVDPDIKKALAAAAKEIGISQGEMIEYLFARYQASQH